MVKKKYVPVKGDLVWIDFDPTLGHEQKGRRPALVMSNFSFNSKTGLVFICPITSTKKDYPSRIKINEKEVSGFIMAEQLKSVDWTIRNITYICKTSPDVTISVIRFMGVVMDF